MLPTKKDKQQLMSYNQEKKIQIPTVLPININNPQLAILP